jgi:hypothetical protein
MKKAFLLISAGMLSYLGPGGMAVASEVPSELSEEPLTLPVSGSSSRSTSNSAGTTINQQTNTQDNNDQFHGFGLGIRCPTPTLGFSLYGGGGSGGSGLDSGVSTSAYGGMITLNLPLGSRNRRTCAELGEAQLRAVQAQTERTQLEAAKVRTDINLVTIQQCLTILQSARLSGRFADACAGIDAGAQAMGLPAPSGAATLPAVNPGPDATPQPSPSVASNPGQPPSRQGIAPTLAAGRLTPQFTSRSQPGQGQIPTTLPQPASTPVSPTLPDQLPSIARPIAVAPAIEEVASGQGPQDLPVIAPEIEEVASGQGPQDLPVIAPAIEEVASGQSPQDLPVIAPAIEEVASGQGPQDLPVIAPVIAPPSVQASRTVANPTALASLPSIARVQPASAAVSTPGQPEAPPPTTPAEVTASPARSTVAAPTSRVAELPAIARIAPAPPRPVALVSAPEKSGGVEFSTPPGDSGPMVETQLAVSPQVN